MDQGLSIAEVIRPVGLFKLRVFRHGKLIERFEAKNLVVTGGKTLLSLLLGGTVSNNSVTKIGFGSNAVPPAAGDTALASQFLKTLDSTTFPSAGEVLFGFSLGPSENNGAQISEFGLITAGGSLFARRVRATALNKDASISLTGSWRITF